MAQVRRSSQSTQSVRMGPLTIFALIAVICLAVLAVLAVSTSNATIALAERRAEATTQLYLDERAANAFVAELDAQLAEGADTGEAITQATAAALSTVPADSPWQLDVSASQGEDGTIAAAFDCHNGRQLNIALLVRDDASPVVTQWNMTTVVNDEPTMGNLLGSS